MYLFHALFHPVISVGRRKASKGLPANFVAIRNILQFLRCVYECENLFTKGKSMLSHKLVARELRRQIS